MISSYRQREIIDLVAVGLSNREVGERLGIKERSVKAYLYDIYNQCGASNRVELTLWNQAHRNDEIKSAL